MFELIKQRRKSLQLVGAILIGLAGQWLLSIKSFFFSGFAFFLAIAIFVTILGPEKVASFRVSFSRGFEKILLSRSSKTLFAISIILASLSFFLFEATENSLFAWVIHILSLIFLFIAIYDLSSLHKPLPDKTDATRLSGRAILIGILVFGALIRFVRLDSLPFGLWYDEADFGIKAMELLSGEGIYPVFFPDITALANYIYLMAASFKIFGTSMAALRLVSAGFGVATIAAAYFMGRELFNPKFGLILAFLLAFSRWDINSSRIGMYNVTVPFFELLVIALLLRAFRRMSLMDFGLAGLTLGLSLSFYASLRIFPILIAIWFLIKWLRQRDFFRSVWPGLIIFTVAFLVTLVPIAQYAVYHPEPFWNRINDTSIFKGRTFKEALPAVVETTREHLLMFNYEGDHNGRHNLPGQPMLDPISATLMVIGLGVALSRWRDSRYFLLIAWFFLMLAPGIFSLDFESPQSLRAIGSMPAAYLLAAIPIYELWRINESEYIPLIKKGVRLFLGILFAIVFVYNLSLYFTYQAKSNSSWLEFSTRETIIGHEMARIGNEADYYLSTFFYRAPSIRFLAPNVTTTHNLETYDVFPLDNSENKRRIFYIDAERKPFFDLVRQYFPYGDFSKIKSPEGITVLYKMDLLPADYWTNQGLRASYFQNLEFRGTPFYVDRQRDFQIKWNEKNLADFPYAVQWDGILYAPEFGLYHFEILPGDRATLFIDDQSVAISPSEAGNLGIILAKGNHRIRVQSVVEGGQFSLSWQLPDDEMRQITSNWLFVEPVTANGLLGQYYASPDWSGDVAYAQIDPFINFYYHNQPLPRPYTVEWQGQIDIPVDGEYVFGLQSIDESQLILDDELLIDVESRDAYMEATIFLTAGKHPIRVRYADRTGYTYIQLYWTPPDGETVIIPQEVLSFP